MKDEKLLEVFFVTMEHFFPRFIRQWLGKITDPRNPRMITYSLNLLLLEGLFLFVFKLGARRDINFQLATKEFRENVLGWLAAEGLKEKTLERLGHGDTVDYLLSKLDPKYLAGLPTHMVQRLIRMRALEKYRLFGKYYLVAIDGTWERKFKQEHCSQCLRMKKGVDRNGMPVYVYYHAVLEAKLVTEDGLAFSIATEFIENLRVDESKSFDKQKQDCELKAFYRLAEKLKKLFPQLNICLLMDGLYAGKPVFDICENNRWKYIITFKEGSMPAVYQEFEALKKLSPKDSLHREKKDVVQDYWWVNEIDYGSHKLNVLECKESASAKNCRFVWLTNFMLTHGNVEILANKGGRCRWKIENEGFNTQKTGGYGLEHAYSFNNTASKNFYFLLQIAHIINQLMEKGSLLKDKLLKLYGSIKNFSTALLNAFTSKVFSFNPEFLNCSIQIRLFFNSS